MTDRVRDALVPGLCLSEQMYNFPVAYFEQTCYNYEKEKGEGWMVGQPVDVIALCSADGEVSPLRLRLESEENGALRMNIDRVVSRRPIETVGAEGFLFLCRATAEERPCIVELCYSTRAHTWRLLRRQDSFITKTSSNIFIQP